MQTKVKEQTVCTSTTHTKVMQEYVGETQPSNMSNMQTTGLQ